MKSKKNQLQELTKTRIRPHLRQINQESGWQAEDNKKLAIRFSPTAWAKLLYFRDKTDNEMGGFGITEAGDLLYVADFVTVRQDVTGVSVKFDDAAVADFFDQQVDLGRKPEQFARIWLHSHPGDSPEPSLTDEETFERVFGNCQWAVMFILAQNSRVYARLSFNVGPGGQALIPVEVDYSQDFGPSSRELWDIEYQANIRPVGTFHYSYGSEQVSVDGDCGSATQPYDVIGEIEKMGPDERHLVLDELADRPDLWNEGIEVFL